MDGILYGFEVALTPENLLWVLLGCLIGTVTGLLPGLGPTATVAVLLPLTYRMDPASAIILLAGIFYGAMFGGRIPAILLNLPGDGASVITTFDGYPLRKQGKAGSALAITAIGSFIGGTVAIIGITLFAPVASQWALRIGAPELFTLALLGMILIAVLAEGSVIKGLIGAGIGILIAVIGLDNFTGAQRFTFGADELMDGVSIVPLAVGLFGVGEILVDAERRFFRSKLAKVDSFWPDWKALTKVRGAIARSSVLGFFLGLIPGGGGAMASVVAYGAEKRFSKEPEKFGKGAMDGLAATETADNAASNSSFVPLLTLGIPPNPVIALIAGALIIHGITPGPQLINSNPEIFWGVIASMYIGVVVLLIMNLPMIGLFVQILRVPAAILNSVIITIAVCGVYSVRNSLFDVFLMFFFGIIGYGLKKLRIPPGPLILGFILAPIMEAELRRSLRISDGSFSIFFERPISVSVMAFIGVMVLSMVVPWKKVFRRTPVAAGGPDSPARPGATAQVADPPERESRADSDRDAEASSRTGEGGGKE
ncbi:tripartite tricarboxylate transporter permease [Pseudactinotalea sp. Z1748]|uniref:tripartite tricarboxylate transporter permease n=1 Tax=Pseudactinotalea sp. Z1748 TaxID=3413027 RepID=UPI003C7A30A8